MVNRHFIYSEDCASRAELGRRNRGQENQVLLGVQARPYHLQILAQKRLVHPAQYQHDRSTGSFAVLGRLGPGLQLLGTERWSHKDTDKGGPTPTVLYRYIIIETHLHHGHPGTPEGHSIIYTLGTVSHDAVKGTPRYSHSH